jgi:hypothetical protein
LGRLLNLSEPRLIFSPTTWDDRDAMSMK